MPVEVVETSAPLQFLRKELRQDSGWPGHQQGGEGQTVEFTVDTARPWQLNAVTSRLQVAPEGIFGSEAGALGQFLVNGERVTTQSRLDMQPGDTEGFDSHASRRLHAEFWSCEYLHFLPVAAQKTLSLLCQFVSGIIRLLLHGIQLSVCCFLAR